MSRAVPPAFRRVKIATSAAVVLVAACGASGPQDANRAEPDRRPAEGPSPTETKAAGAQTLPPVDPDEAFMDLERAQTACRERDFGSFLDALIWSESARRAYSAPFITVTRFGAHGRADRRQVALNAYAEFPIRMEDFYRKPSAAVSDAGADEYVELAFNQSQGDVFAVSWTRVRYDGQTEGGDDLGRALTLNGDPLPAGYAADGTLIFAPHEGCWRLVADERFDR